MQKTITNPNATFGTLPVFMTAISTILGAILFLRFGYAVGNVGFLGVIGIILIGHLITIPTALAVAEIATNQKVQGGGAYFIISRSFGLNIGGAIGLALFFSQAISVAFYIIAFGEAFEPLLNYLQLDIPDALIKKGLTLFVMSFLAFIVITRGANIGMKALYFVVALLFTAIIFFFAGTPTSSGITLEMNQKISQPDSFFYVFTILFPAFTGMAAGLGLSGDLKDPKKSIPRGTMLATLVGMIIYFLVAYKLTISATPDELANDQLIMQKIAIWGPIIPIGLAAATLSSAIGSLLVAPRTLQAIGYDSIFPIKNLNNWLAKGKQKDNDPTNGSIITIIIAYFFIIVGDVDFVAQIISMFFMVTYGAICLISFMEYFAADPSYRPTFKQNRWFLSLLGALLSFWLMFKMNTPYAIISLVLMTLMYLMINKYHPERRGLEKLFKGVIFQISRQIQIFVQRANKEEAEYNWRPFIICVSEASFKRRAAFDLLRWVSHKHGFGTYIHFIKGFLNREAHSLSKKYLERLINLAEGSNSRVYLDTIISPSYTSAIAQVIQLSGISGKGNNLILFEYTDDEPENLKQALDNYQLFEATEFDVAILRSSIKGFGYNKEIHVWITPNDFHNANLMILMAYIILGNAQWQKGVIKIFALFPAEQLDKQRKKLLELIKSGRLPISKNNIQVIPLSDTQKKQEIITSKSHDADLTITGFTNNSISEGATHFLQYPEMGNVLFINAYRKKEIK